jgi:SAM-dependent methyltransferase
VKRTCEACGVTRPFRTTAPYYARYRPAYPPELITRLAEAAGVGRDARVLDLGCGPGTVAIPFAAHAGEVVALDREPAMIAELRRVAPPNLVVIEGQAEDVDESWGSFRLATAGRSFHWFDAPFVLQRLTAVTPAVALLGDDSRDSEAQSLTLAIAAELIDAPSIARPKFRYEDILHAGPFSDVEVISVEVERTWTPDELIGMAYSTSAASLERLGDRREEFEARIRAELEPEYRERVGVDAVLGRLQAT